MSQRYPDQYNSEGYLDMTAYLATRHLQCRRTPREEDWIFNRGDIYLANLNPCKCSNPSSSRPVVVLQNNSGNIYCPILIVAPLIPSDRKKHNSPASYFIPQVKGLEGSYIALLEKICTIDKRQVSKFLGKMTFHQIDAMSEVLKTALNIYISEDLEAP